MPRGFRRAAAVGGGVLVLVGLIGLVLPLVPGTAFLLAGVVLWSTEFGWAKQLLARVKQWIKDCSSQERRRELLSLNPPMGRAQRTWRYGGNAS